MTQECVNCMLVLKKNPKAKQRKIPPIFCLKCLNRGSLNRPAHRLLFFKIKHSEVKSISLSKITINSHPLSHSVHAWQISDQLKQQNKREFWFEPGIRYGDLKFKIER